MRELCDEHGLLLVLDEVQCGMGRTGKLFAHEWAGITPDLMAVAKGIGGGFPLGALLATEEAAKGMAAGTHGSTYGGNPLATAVGNAVLDAVLEPGFLDAVRQKTLRLKQALAAVQGSPPRSRRGGARRRPAHGPQAQGADGRRRSRPRIEEQLLVAGASGNVVRLLPPLNVADEEIAERADRLSRALDRVAARPPDNEPVSSRPERHGLENEIYFAAAAFPRSRWARRQDAAPHHRHGARDEAGGQAGAGRR